MWAVVSIRIQGKLGRIRDVVLDWSASRRQLLCGSVRVMYSMVSAARYLLEELLLDIADGGVGGEAELALDAVLGTSNRDQDVLHGREQRREYPTASHRIES